MAAASVVIQFWVASATLSTTPAHGQEKLLLTIKGHTEAVLSVAFSPDGKRLAMASIDEHMRIWDTSSGREVFTLKGHTGSVNSVAFSSDGNRVASAGDDKTVRVWDRSTGE